MTDHHERTCRPRGVGLVVAALLLALPACESAGHFNVLGYSSKPNYNCAYRTIYVPIFKNKTFRRGLEFDLTRAVVREIEAKTPYKVVSNCDSADTELIGTITGVTKALVNINPQNEVREAETTLSVEIIWRDRRTGEVLSQPQRQPNVMGNAPLAAPPLNMGNAEIAQGAAPIPLGTRDVPPPYLPPDEQPLAPPPPPPPVLIQSLDHYIPELGQSTASALSGNVDRLAIQIVSMMETPW